MARYRKIPIEIEAFQYTGDLMDKKGQWIVPVWAVEAYKSNKMWYGYKNALKEEPPTELFIDSIGGRLHVGVGDYVLLNQDGEIYTQKKDLFEATYKLL